MLQIPFTFCIHHAAFWFSLLTFALLIMFHARPAVNENTVNSKQVPVQFVHARQGHYVNAVPLFVQTLVVVCGHEDFFET